MLRILMAAGFMVLKVLLHNNMIRVCLLVGIILSGVGCEPKQTDKTAVQQTATNDLPYYTSPDFTPQWIEKGSGRLDTIHTIAAFSFIDQNGDTITDKTVANKIYIADFFFTACPGICPKLTKNLKKVQDAFGSLHACLNDIYDILKELCDSVSLEPERLAGEIHAQLHYGRTERIIEQGLHEYLMDFLDRLAVLNGEINSHFFAPTDR